MTMNILPSGAVGRQHQEDSQEEEHASEPGGNTLP